MQKQQNITISYQIIKNKLSLIYFPFHLIKLSTLSSFLPGPKNRLYIKYNAKIKIIKPENQIDKGHSSNDNVSFSAYSKNTKKIKI